MLDNLFSGLFDSTAVASSIALGPFLACVGVALTLGLVIALFYTYKNSATKSFLATLVLLPAIVCVVILMVNGNIGAGVAVAGAFSLIRFRSVPGTAKEIASIFLAMAAGLVGGMGYLGYAAIFVLIIGFAGMLLTKLKFGETDKPICDKTLRITIPEDLDYTGVFDDLFSEYTTKHALVTVKTTNMGSLFKLTYNITLRNTQTEKEFIDKLRCRNGNLEISSSLQEVKLGEL
ncbi:MAG: DUF4956 domain-containing protein [Firmicutes bacterium HGW-Firmicutes-16]|nr:MAG: DUF4956 domain-containing protein [Firmicutes bacterium HGW-Firmicutes-16]